MTDSPLSVLVRGRGAREHAIARRLADSASVANVIVSPGNPGMALSDAIALEPEPLSPDCLRSIGVDLIVSAGTDPTPAGATHKDKAKPRIGLVAASDRAAAEFEENRLTAKEHMLQVGIPTPRFHHAAEAAIANSMVEEMDHAMAIKACAPISGRRVFVCATPQEGRAALESLSERGAFREKGALLEEALTGVEVSMVVMTNGRDFSTLPPVWLFSRGAGAIAPHPRVDAEALHAIEREIIQPTIDFINLQQWEYRGFLTFRTIVTERGPFLLEYAVQIGDPEAQALMPLLDGDLGEVLAALAAGAVPDITVRAESACAVELTASNAGVRETGTRHLSDVGAPAEPVPLYGDVRISDDALVVAGPRVATIVGMGETLDAARTAAYRRVLSLNYPGQQYRRDIGGAPIAGEMLEEGEHFAPQFARRGGVLPVIVQHEETGEVLMLGYADLAAIRETQRTGRATFFSTSRKRHWTKGETSGNWLEVSAIQVDCDQDALLYRVRLHGSGVCHTTNKSGEPRRTCFYRVLGDEIGEGKDTADGPFSLLFLPDLA